MYPRSATSIGPFGFTSPPDSMHVRWDRRMRFIDKIDKNAKTYKTNGVSRTLKRLRTSKGNNWIKQRFNFNSRPSSPVRQDGERRTTFFDEYAFRRVPFFLVLAHFSLRLPLIFNLLMQSSITLVARVVHRPT